MSRWALHQAAQLRYNGIYQRISPGSCLHHVTMYLVKTAATDHLEGGWGKGKRKGVDLIPRNFMPHKQTSLPGLHGDLLEKDINHIFRREFSAFATLYMSVISRISHASPV